MIHLTNLPPAVEQALSNAVSVQLGLFEFAATEQLNKSDVEQQKRCTQFIYGRPDPAHNATEWLWENDKLFAYLQGFSGGTVSSKVDWAREIRADVMALFNAALFDDNQQPALTTLRTPLHLAKPNPNNQWQHDGHDFLEHWYVVFSSQTGLPAVVTGGKPLSRQVFLNDYLKCNPSQKICPACDSHEWQDALSNKPPLAVVQPFHVYTDTDHFFAKDLYPHLSIHPYNLIPLCEKCNERFKLTRDAMEWDSVRRTLYHLAVPYRRKALSSDTYVKFSAIKNEPVQLLRRPASTIPTERISMMKHLFKIPDRWSADGQTDKYDFNGLLRGWIRNSEPQGPVTAAWLREQLTQYTGQVRRELGKAPRHFMLLSWLSQQVKLLEKLPAEDTRGTALLKDVNQDIREKEQARRQDFEAGQEFINEFPDD